MTAVKNVTLQDIREMDTDSNLPRSPAETCEVHRSFVQEEENERLAIARRLRQTLPFPSSSSSENEKLTARLESEEASNSESCNDPTQAENAPLASSRKAEESDKDEHKLSPVFVDIPESGWVLNDDVYMAKVYENIRWR